MPTGAIRWLVLAGVLAAGYFSLVLFRNPVTEEPTIPRVATAAAQQAELPPGEVAPFELTDENGKPFDSASLKGKVWVASFFFTNCPAVCWRMNQALAAWQHTHPESDVRFVSITCDPDNDTPEALARYAAHFKADPKRWTFLTGDMKAIENIGQGSFKIAVVKGDHTDRACVVDRQGRVRGRFRLTEPDQVEMLDRLLTVLEAEPAQAPPSDATDAPAPADAAAARSAETPLSRVGHRPRLCRGIPGGTRDV
jgi:protein SCO1/2